jgi:hypothetical protein
VSKAHTPPHKNPRTKKWLENREQVCTSCWENFGTTGAGDSHRDLTGVKFECLSPEDVGLIPTKNGFGTTVWRLPN